VRNAFLLPQDVQDIHTPQLMQIGARNKGQWLVVGGFECQDLSPAGKCKGLDGPHSRTFYDLVRIIGMLQQLQWDHAPGYLIENTAAQYNFNSRSIREYTYPRICAAIGDPVCLDAARFGSRAHRLCNWLTNLADANHLQSACDRVMRPDGLLVDDILDPHRTAQVVKHSDRHPFYLCNHEGQPMQALPTLMAYVGSRAFVDCGPGVLWDAARHVFCEPNVHERERALGYPVDATAAVGVSMHQRHVITGRCMDGNTTRSLLAIAAALNNQQMSLAALLSVDPPPSDGLARYGRYGIGATIMLQGGWRPDPATGNNIVSSIMPVERNSRPGIGYPRMLRESNIQSWEAQPPSLAAMAATACPYDARLSVLPNLAWDHLHLCALSSNAVHEEGTEPSSKSDVWHDTACLQFLRTAKLPLMLSASDQRRILRRSKLYVFVGKELHRRMKDGSERIVPAPADRIPTVKQIHARTGHFGQKRTRHLVLHSYWWKGTKTGCFTSYKNLRSMR
jgi:hypothetical protein